MSDAHVVSDEKYDNQQIIDQSASRFDDVGEVPINDDVETVSLTSDSSTTLDESSDDEDDEINTEAATIAAKILLGIPHYIDTHKDKCGDQVDYDDQSEYCSQSEYSEYNGEAGEAGQTTASKFEEVFSDTDCDHDGSSVCSDVEKIIPDGSLYLEFTGQELANLAKKIENTMDVLENEFTTTNKFLRIFLASYVAALFVVICVKVLTL